MCGGIRLDRSEHGACLRERVTGTEQRGPVAGVLAFGGDHLELELVFLAQSSGGHGDATLE